MATFKQYPASERGHYDFGWLKTAHIFSFGEYHDPSRMGFGALRVLNDDVVVGGAGFGTHPHRNMEIISIPLEGILVHRDSMGHEEALTPGEVQVMSAGSGITHSEYNGSDSIELKFLQIWIIPDKQGVQPRYDQKKVHMPQDTIVGIVGPLQSGMPLWIHQNAYLSIGTLGAGTGITYEQHVDSNITFVFVVDGDVRIGSVSAGRRDGVGIIESPSVPMVAERESQVVVIEVPTLMN